MYDISVVDENDIGIFGIAQADFPVPRAGEFILDPTNGFRRLEVTEVEYEVDNPRHGAVSRVTVTVRTKKVPLHSHGQKVLL